MFLRKGRPDRTNMKLGDEAGYQSGAQAQEINFFVPS
jgi:hypothetical protein